MCPPPELVYPCVCVDNHHKTTAVCSNFTNSEDLKNIFDRTPGWKLQEVLIENSVMNYIPSAVVEDPHFKILNVRSTILIQLFNEPPVTNSRIDVNLHNVTLLRGLDWHYFSNMNIRGLKIDNFRIKSFGKTFKTEIPKSVSSLKFYNSKTVSITDNAFSELDHLVILGIENGYIKTISRDMFPRPWWIHIWRMSNQRISVLPEDIFSDLPNLAFLDFSDNLLTTISENSFLQERKVFFSLSGNPFVCNCKMKWIPAYERTKESSIMGKCAAPETFKGERFTYLQDSDFWYCE
ncbi:Slit like protein [Argiope bruennichi]|uniref:Slit like protein n=2 Tax=Argiope bruennichi TaxID=94029 RepID=A0A8T0EAW3_ARGBR|nr:Slit like protein [Argiope bruennichi]